MNTLKSINTRKLLVVPVFAALAAYAQASQAADGMGDTQTQVRTVLEGARPSIHSTRSNGGPSRAADIQENTRQVLLGADRSNTGVRIVGGRSTATPSAAPGVNNDHGGGDSVQRQTQRVLFGRAAS
ncbi:MAG: hypothetical protein ACJ8R9_30100 [Steroidobacteraceae bacterium]